MVLVQDNLPAEIIDLLSRKGFAVNVRVRLQLKHNVTRFVVGICSDPSPKRRINDNNYRQALIILVINSYTKSIIVKDSAGACSQPAQPPVF
jgi:hypothetical protein